jgi:hypothetical protein
MLHFLQGVYVLDLQKKLIFFSVLALVAPLVSALTVSVADGATSGGNITINWTTDSSDPYVDHTSTPLPFPLTAFLVPPGRSSWSTHHLTMTSASPTMLIQRLIL